MKSKSKASNLVILHIGNLTRVIPISNIMKTALKYSLRRILMPPSITINNKKFNNQLINLQRLKKISNLMTPNLLPQNNAFFQVKCLRRRKVETINSISRSEEGYYPNKRLFFQIIESTRRWCDRTRCSSNIARSEEGKQ